MFELHPQLAQDGIPLGHFQLCRLLLVNEARYPWFVLVPQRVGISEIFQLAATEQALLIQESSALARALQVFQPDKLNIAAIGNVVPQLHLHHVVRFRTDAAWPGPVWGKFPIQSYSAERLVEVKSQINAALPAEFQRTSD